MPEKPTTPDPVVADDKITCETPTSGKKSVRIERWKYNAVRRAILNVLPEEGEGLLFKELAGKVTQTLSKEERRSLGSVGWYTTTVKLDLEVRGEIKRVAGANPQRLLRSG